MATIFSKRAGAPAGAINISTSGATYLIDDASNTIITVTSPDEIANLSAQPMLQVQGTNGVPYIPPRTGTSQELAYSEMTVAYASTATSIATSTFPLTANFTVNARPVMVHLYLTGIALNAGQSAGIGISDSVNNLLGWTTVTPSGTTSPINFWKRFSTPGAYQVKGFVYATSATAVIVQAGPSGIGYAPTFLRAIEV